jgi:hypothetical protein
LGSHTHFLYIPSADIWDDTVPSWLAGRFDIVRDRLAAAGQVVRPTPVGYETPLATLTADDD